MNFNSIRSSFLQYFVKNNHVLVRSSSVVPFDDPTLLFTNAGMNQFKDYFLGLEEPIYSSAVSSQKCIRAGGKHNDLSNVGFTLRHLTFFEMLGNFSFGSYFKKETIIFAWKYLTEELKINPEILWVTVYKNDQEAFNIWKNIIGVPENRIVKLGEKDNFWQMGDVGPCGGCSEIYVDRGIKSDQDKIVKPGDEDSIRFVEIWNLVFMEYDRNDKGILKNLKKKGIDTGMGLERLTMILEDVPSVFHTSMFAPLIKYIEEITNIDYKSSNIKQAAFHVLADHIRSSSFIIAEGIIPGNEGRDYVLRKIIRRALLFAYKMGHQKIFSKLVDPLVNTFKEVYPEIYEKKNIIRDALELEQEKFLYTLELGYKRFYSFAKDQENLKVFSGKDAFILYDTYGFPLELTQILAEDQKMIIQEEEFIQEMNQQKERSKKESFLKLENSINFNYVSKFIGYDLLECSGLILDIIDEESKYIICDQTIFYPEGGGQIGDIGIIIYNGISINVINTIKKNNSILIELKSLEGLSLGISIIQKVDEKKRKKIAMHHTATHLLQAGLRKYIGEDVIQKGSYVSSDYLTFDCSLKNSLTLEKIELIEEYINQIIYENISLKTVLISYQDAINTGALAFFTAKYSELVRMVEIKNVSKELCGGTHAKSTGELQLFKLIGTTSISSGVRRITAMVSSSALALFNKEHKSILNYTSKQKFSYDRIEEAFQKEERLIFELKLEQKKIVQELEKSLFFQLVHSKKKYNEYLYNFLYLEFNIINKKALVKKAIQKELDCACILVKEKDFHFIEIQISSNSKLMLNKKEIEIFLENKYQFKGKIEEKNITGLLIVENKNNIEELIQKIIS